MLITINLQDKKGYLYRLFRDLWTECAIECQICFDCIIDDGVVAITEYGTLNLEKMFHAKCLQRWQRERNRDPFNRNVKFYFNFPPKSEEECASLLDQMRGFIGEETADKRYADEFRRVNDERLLDVDLDFSRLLTYS
ncbi:se97 [Alphabaculovirus alterspexiguae]|uniref:Se97 n=1 Tax=Spodoptera exigua multiple nucleopolyhedrovirus TaxID=10454 RepID=A0A3G2JU31_9ABAC|nr:se97 [Spodoptera exigua multiple nucleopolyhedrovirus]AYN45057.1 se97 [Spodoptera exigua multiple nucleopolyhedrovirus]